MQLTDSGRIELQKDGGDEIDAAIAAAKKAVPFAPEEDESPAERPAEHAQGGQKAESSAGESQSANTQEREAAPKREDSPAQPPDRVRLSEVARFHREQKQFFEQKQAFKAEQAELQRIKSVLANAKNDQLAALDLMGFKTEEDGIAQFLEGLSQHGGRVSPERKELNELKAWRAQQEQERAQQQQHYQQQQQQAAMEQQLDTLRTSIKEQIAGEQYKGSIINVKNADEQVMLEMDKMAKESGEMPDVGEAIGRVQANFSKGLEELAQNPAVLTFFERKLAERPSESADTPQSKQRAPRTISGRTPPPSLQNPKSSRPLTDDEEVEAAIARMKAMAR